MNAVNSKGNLVNGTAKLLLSAAGLLVALTRAPAATHYVDALSTNAVSPFTDWITAAATIQDAVDAAVDGDEIVVTNGVYQTGARELNGMNRVAVTKPLTVRSVNGPAVTQIVGSQDPDGPEVMRCVSLARGATLTGFTLSNGATQEDEDETEIGDGGGVWCEGASEVVSNCVLTGNTAFAGGGAFGGTLNNCLLTSNSAGLCCGGAAFGVLNNCELTGNSASDYGGATGYSELINCTLTSNSAGEDGGGAFGGSLNNCTITGNTAVQGAGAWHSGLRECRLTGNSADLGGGVYYSLLDNCTLTGNSADDGGGAYGGLLNNCIVYYNTASSSGANYFGGVVNYSCTTPDPGSGVGNITNAPLFVDTNGWSNLRLQSNSSCINAGNNAAVTSSTDLDGNPRISGGTVDMGAYEFQSPASRISYAWLQQFGLPTDGSADYVDTDHDGHNNWQEWMAGTDPTNALSVLRLASPLITATSVTLTWTSVTNRIYTLEQATNLGGAPAFSVLSSNLAGLPGSTSWTDTNAPVSSPRFYQLRVAP